MFFTEKIKLKLMYEIKALVEFLLLPVKETILNNTKNHLVLQDKIDELESKIKDLRQEISEEISYKLQENAI